MSPHKDPICKFLEWDTQFFGHRTARLLPNTVERSTVADSFAWCQVEGIQCLYILIDANDVNSVRLLEDHGCRFVDIRVTMELRPAALKSVPAAGEPSRIVIRQSVPADIPELVAIARVNHTDSRFYFDTGFSREKCADLYGTWIRKSCQGYATAVLVAELDGRPAGFVSLNLDGSQGSIGLIGVAAAAQGQGAGSGLVRAGIEWLAQNGATSVSVVTQGRNVPGQRLYQRAGFAIKSLELWYHRWFEELEVDDDVSHSVQ